MRYTISVVLHSKNKESKKMNLSLLWKDEGQDLTEYGLLLLFVALVSIVTVQGLGSVVKNVFSNASTSLS